MKTSRKLGTAALTGLLLATAVMPVMAATETSKAEQSQNTKAPVTAFYAQEMKESEKMMGQVNLARRALDLGLKNDAVDHIAKARQIAGELENKSPQLTVASTLRAGGKVYTFNNEYKDYLIPVVDDVFTTANYDLLVKSNPSKDKVAERDTETGRFRLALDIRNVENSLDQAKTFAQEGKIKESSAALNDMYKGAVETVVAYDDPITAVHDNLMASSSMIKKKDFDGARYALKDAEKELTTLEKSGLYSSDSATVKRLEKEISTLHASLSNKDPSVLQKAEKAISGWMKDIRNMKHDDPAKTMDQG